MLTYAVKGIKSLDQLAELEFYKKTITKDLDTQSYNVKGIYGMNGSGKSGIVNSVEILRNILIDSSYLTNPIVQKHLDAIINKKLGELTIKTTFMVKIGTIFDLFQYELILAKNTLGKYVIKSECLSTKKATARKHELSILFRIENGNLIEIKRSKKDLLVESLEKKTANLLETASLSSLFFEKIFSGSPNYSTLITYELFIKMCELLIFGKSIHVYMETSDKHTNYFIHNMLKISEEPEGIDSSVDEIMRYVYDLDNDLIEVISTGENIVPKDKYEEFEKTVNKLFEFIRIFKTDLTDITIDRKEDKYTYQCNLVMVYEDYKINAEFESTGIKKLMKLYAYLNEASNGSIVFIDELDSNLHDVYLCALLEYLMEYGEGQLCFTTHNIGPMDILRRNKKSIDFLSVDHKIYSWKTNGNYSPANLYREGMIEGSPFNIDSIDFIGMFDNGEEVS